MVDRPSTCPTFILITHFTWIYVTIQMFFIENVDRFSCAAYHSLALKLSCYVMTICGYLQCYLTYFCMHSFYFP